MSYPVAYATRLDAALRCRRRFVGVELKDAYFKQAVEHLSASCAQVGLFAA